MTTRITESAIETFAIQLLEHNGYQHIHGPSCAPDSPSPERNFFSEALLLKKLKRAVGRINPTIPPESRDDAIAQIQRLNSPELIANNEAFHRALTEGITISFEKDGDRRGDLVWLVDFKNPENNDFMALNQFTVIENGVNKRPDLVLFVNGIPLAVMELKNPAEESATMRSAFRQLQTYKQAIPGLFVYNGALIISDGLEAKAGSISSDFSRFMAWKTSNGQTNPTPPPLASQLETLITGMLNKKTLLDMIRHFTVFEKTKKEDPKTGIITIKTYVRK